MRGNEYRLDEESYLRVAVEDAASDCVTDSLADGHSLSSDISLSETPHVSSIQMSPKADCVDRIGVASAGTPAADLVETLREGSCRGPPVAWPRCN